MSETNRASSTGGPRAGWRDRSAVLLGKALIGATRLLRRGGTTLPGRAALMLSPRLISSLSGQLARGTIAITGTNGKTTTAALLAAMLRRDGRPCVHNEAGSNLAWGVASTLIEAASWRGGLPGEDAVLEIDEGAFPAMSGSLRPRAAVITNIFRDQLDRFGGVEQVRAALQEGVLNLPPGASIFLNADDPLVASLEGGSGEVLHYGLDPHPPPAADPPAAGGTAPLPCPRCGRELSYSHIYFAHLGRYRCPSCGFHRPEPEFILRRFAAAPGKGTAMILSLRGRPLRATLPLPGIYNLYNALAAAAAASALGLSEGAIGEALGGAVPPSGRMEQRRVGSREVLTALIKNPAGANQVLDTLLQGEPGQPFHLLIAINNHPADGADLTWLWETDFEQLAAARSRIADMTISGMGAPETARRLEGAGFHRSEMTVNPSLPQALRQAMSRTAPGERLIILPNYTALQQVRPLLDRIMREPQR